LKGEFIEYNISVPNDEGIMAGREQSSVSMELRV
jgi:hypothetical protein